MLSHQEKCKICGYKVPLYFWFVVSGAACDIVQAIIDYLISLVYFLPVEKETVCWTLSYIISIWIRHYSHRIIVFGEFEGTYCASLARTYLAYSSSIIASALTNHALVQYLSLTHKQAWVVTMLWTGILNYFLLKSSWKSKAVEKEIRQVVDSPV
jgi:hypothetical protein